MSVTTNLKKAYANILFSCRKHGYTMSDEWSNRDTFIEDLLDLGYTDDYTVRRIDTKLPYSKENVKVTVKKKSISDDHARILRMYTTMHAQCYAEYRKDSKYYQDITVCKAWKYNYKAFSEWAVEQEFKGKQLSRIDKKKNYSPSNCELVNNGSDKAILLYSLEGELIDEFSSLTDTAKYLGVTVGAVSNCLHCKTVAVRNFIPVRKKDNLLVYALDEYCDIPKITIKKHLLRAEIDSDNIKFYNALIKDIETKLNVSTPNFYKIAVHGNKITIFVWSK